jgi:hypothetical protein
LLSNLVYLFHELEDGLVAHVDPGPERVQSLPRDLVHAVPQPAIQLDDPVPGIRIESSLSLLFFAFHCHKHYVQSAKGKIRS